MTHKKILEAIDENNIDYLNSLTGEDEEFVKEALNLYNRSYINKHGLQYVPDKNNLNEVSMSLKPTINLSLDNDGSILIKKHENVDFMTIYQNSHELLKEYWDKENIEGIKYELCKLWMMIVLIDKNYLHAKSSLKQRLITNEDKKYATKAKAFIMNDFKTYLRKVLTIEKDFNFSEYFNQTQFGVEVYKLDKRLLNMIKHFI